MKIAVRELVGLLLGSAAALGDPARGLTGALDAGRVHVEIHTGGAPDTSYGEGGKEAQKHIEEMAREHRKHHEEMDRARYKN